MNQRILYKYRFRLAASIQSFDISSKKLEEKYGLPPIPQKARSPYSRFIAENCSQMRKENPGLKHSEVIQLCAKEWAELNIRVKEKMREDYIKENLAYRQELFRYNQQLTEEQKSSIEAEINAIEQRDFKTEKQRVHKKVSNRKTSLTVKLQLFSFQQLLEMHRPKQPPSAFNRFFQEALLNENEKLPMPSMLKLCSQRWRDLPEEKKLAYEESYKAHNEVYKSKLVNWELAMIKAGYVHLVRKATLLKSVETARKQNLKESARKKKHSRNKETSLSSLSS